MSTEQPQVTREFLHQRNVNVRGYLRSDGLWDIEGTLEDTKGYDIHLLDKGLVPEGGFLHQMKFTISIDDSLTIREVTAEMAATPYLDCPAAEKAYQNLVGIQIAKGWLEKARKAVGRDTSCTHITEMLPAMATSAIMTIRGHKIQNSGNDVAHEKGLLGSCHGFRKGGRAQTRLWPDEGQADEVALSFGDID